MIKDIKIYNCWEDITISKYIEIQSLDDKSEDYEDELVKLLSSLTDDDLKYIDDDILNDIKSNMIFIFNPPKKNKINSVFIDGIEYFNSSNKLTISQYISIQPLFINSIDNIHKVISNILIPINTKYNDDSYSIEDLGNLIYNKLSLPDALSLLDDITNTFLMIPKKYPSFFNEKDEDDDDEEGEEEVDYSFEKVWSWMILTEEVIKYTNLNINEVWNMKVDDYFTYCSYIKDKRLNESEQIKKIKNS